MRTITRAELHPNIVRTFKRLNDWYRENGYEDWSYDKWYENMAILTNDVFTIAVLGSEEYQGNCGIFVFNRDGILLDYRICRYPQKNDAIPLKTNVLGAFIINGSEPMKPEPFYQKDPPFIVE